MTPTPHDGAPRADRPAAGPQEQRRAAGLTVIRLWGVPVVLTPSWFLLVGLVTLAYGPRLDDGSGGLARDGYLVSLTFALLLALAVILHEVGHLAVARGLGIPVRRLTVFLLGGATEMTRQPRTPAGEYLVAIAGPTVSLVLGATSLGLSAVPPSGGTAEAVLRDLGVLNLLLAGFNLLPAVPLDGGRVLRSIVWRLTGNPLTGTRAAAWGGRVLAVVVSLGAFVLAGLTPRDAGVTDAVLTALFGGLLAAFLWAGSSAALRTATVEARLPALRARDLARPWLGVRADVPVAEAVRRARAAGARALVVLDGAERPAALVSEAAVRATEPARQPWVEVRALARALSPGTQLAASLEGAAVVEALRATPAGEYLVRDGDAVTGVLAAEDVGAVLAGRLVPPGGVARSSLVAS